MVDELREFKAPYRKIMDDHFPECMEISFADSGGKRQTLFYRKVSWKIPKDGELVEKGLRYGENPGQEAALYKLVNGRLILGDVQTIHPGKWLMSDVELLQSGKHPGKTNITDADAALGILRYMPDKPTVAIMKHNNPCGVARRDALVDAYLSANEADRIAAFGGTIALNRAVDKATAEAVSERYAEVIVAPDYETGTLDVLRKKRDLRVMRVTRMDLLQEYDGVMYPEFKSLVDGGIIAQWPFVPKPRKPQDLKCVTNREPTPNEYRDMLFGWYVESGVTSNSVLFVKDDTTIAIGTGGQDRVGVAEATVAKAYRNYADGLAWNELKKPFTVLTAEESEKYLSITEAAKPLEHSVYVSDAFFPFKDGALVGINKGASAIIQPGGSIRDKEVVDTCNEHGVAMVFTGQRSFKH